MINKFDGLSPSGGLVSPSGGFASLLFDQVGYFASIKLCQALSRQRAIIKIPVIRCHYLLCLGAQYFLAHFFEDHFFCFQGVFFQKILFLYMVRDSREVCYLELILYLKVTTSILRVTEGTSKKNFRSWSTQVFMLHILHIFFTTYKFHFNRFLNKSLAIK